MVRSINRKTWLLRTGRAAAGAEQEQQQQHLVRHVKRYKWASHTGSAGSTGRTRADAGGHNATERNIWINAIFYFHILLLLPYNGPDHTHTHTHTLTHACALRGASFDSYKWPVLVLWTRGRCEGRGDCNQSADINIFRVANRKLLRLLQQQNHTLSPSPSPRPHSPESNSRPPLVLAISDRTLDAD